MKKTWKYLTTSSVITALLVSGCATPAAMKGPSGLTGQQLHNIGQPATSSSWLPKFMQPAPAQPKFSGGTNVTELAATTPAPKSGKPKKVDSLSMARLHEKRGQLDQAVKLYERELKTNSKKAFIHHRLAVIAAREGHWDKSREHFAESCRIEPRNAGVLSDLGYSLYLQHQLPEAEQCLLEAVEIDPQNKSAQNNLGIVLGVLGKYEQSLAAFRRAVPDAEAHANLGYVHMQLGDADKAMGELNQALTLDKNLKKAAVALVQLDELKHKLTPKDVDQMTIASKSAKRAASETLAQTSEPVAHVADEPAGQPSVAVANPAPAAQVPAAFAHALRAPEQVTAPPPAAQHLMSGHLASEAKPRETKIAAAPLTAVDSRIRELPERLPPPSSYVNLSGLGTQEPASNLPIATLVDPVDAVVQASAQVNTAPPLLQVAASEPPQVAPAQAQVSSQPAPVFKPSQRIQVVRSQAQAASRPTTGPQYIVNENVPPQPDAQGNSDLVGAVRGAQEAGARTSVVKPTTGATPSQVPQVAMPRPEDMLPANAQFNQMPTHQLHPTASPTWTAPSAPTPASNSSATGGGKAPLPRVKVMPN